MWTDTFWGVFRMWYCSMFCTAALLDWEKSCSTVIPLAVVSVGRRKSQAAFVGAKTVRARLESFR